MGGRVLVVDDEPDVRQTLADHLRAAIDGVEILQARDGEEALELLEGEDVDLLVVDQRMPRLDGVGLLERLQEAGRLLPAIMFTAYADTHLAVKALNQGHVRRFYPKPGDPVQLADAVREELAAERHRRHREAAWRRADPDVKPDAADGP